MFKQINRQHPRAAWQRNWKREQDGWLAPPDPLMDQQPNPVKKIAVGIITYNNDMAELRSCLLALEQAIVSVQNHCEVNVLVVDNGHSSSDALRNWEWIERLESRGNVGFGAGHNRLMDQAFATGAQAYVAMNPDGRSHPRMLQELWIRNAQCSGGALLEALQFPCEHAKTFDPRHGETTWASGACLWIPHRIYASIGGFDDTFFMYCEDVDLSWRARAAGFRVVTAPKALFLHRVTNRPNDEFKYALLLAAGVQLGYKWNARIFEMSVRMRLQRLEEIVSTLPEQAFAQPAKVAKKDRWAASFDHGFCFARPRW